MTYIPPTPLLASIVSPTSPPPSPHDLLSLVFVRPLRLCQSPFFLFSFFLPHFASCSCSSSSSSPIPLLFPLFFFFLLFFVFVFFFFFFPATTAKANPSKRTDLLPNFAPLASYTTYCRSVRAVCRLAACLDISTCAISGPRWPFSKFPPRNKSIRSAVTDFLSFKKIIIQKIDNIMYF